jgi:hypothetical protein
MIQILAITYQHVQADGVSFAGNTNFPVTADSVDHVVPAIVELHDNIQKMCPGARGVVMCDYMHDEQSGRVTLFDPGLRPSANTAGALLRMWVEARRGITPGVQSNHAIKLSEHGCVSRDVSFAEVVDALGDLAVPDRVRTEGYGILPFGWNYRGSDSGNPIGPNGRFILITPSCKPEHHNQACKELIGCVNSRLKQSFG